MPITSADDRMRVLNIDLDFFLNDRAHNRPDDPSDRPDDWGLVPWKSSDVVRYLEEVLNLKDKIPGAIVQSHHEVFYYWRDLIKARRLAAPFFVAHVDAHSDLGMGMPCWVYLHSDFLELPLAKRPYPNEGTWGLNFGSYMGYALGNRWISEIDFIAPDFWRDDISDFLLANDSLSADHKPGVSLEIELMHAPREQIEEDVRHFRRDFLSFRKSIGEPKVPFNIIGQEAARGRYSGQQWDYVFLSHSPGYVPTEADALIPVISEYIARL